MFSTSSKIAFGYILLVCLLFGAIGYIYQQITLLTEPTGLEENINNRRRTTHQIISKLYEAEIIGQTLHVGHLHEYPTYRKAMKEVGISIDSLQTLLTDTLQQSRLDTVRTLIQDKERNMMLVLEALRQSPTDELYRQQLENLIAQQDSLLRNSTRIQRKIITHHSSYTIHHQPKKFFRRLRDVFAPGKADSTLVNNVIQEEYTDTIDESYNPIDTIASMITGIQDKVFQTRQEQQRMLDSRTNRLRIAGSNLSKRVNQLLENIELDEQTASNKKMQQETAIRKQAAWTMATIAILAVILVLAFSFIVWRDLTRSNHYRRELEKAKSYAENLLVAREKLMLTITHDIKAPAGSIIGYIELLTRLIQEKRQLFYLNNMKSSAQHLLNLVTSLLDYHRLEAGKMDLHPVSFNPHQLFSNIYNSFLPLANKKQLQLRFEERTAPDLTLEGDPFRIRQIAENLLSNALKFTAEGSITLGTNYQGNQFIFSVSDTGCGMTEQEQERIFKEFTRLRSAQGQEGFGLGLSITHKLVELLQGKINVESSPGKGSAFQVSMPLPSISSKPSTQENNIVPVHSTKPIRILLIDDDRIQMNLTEALLTDLLISDNSGDKTFKPEVRCCEQPEEILQLLSRQPFDLILTDIQMPAMNGFELLKAIRNLDIPQAKTIPIIAITARGDLNESDFQIKGFSGMLQKPFNQSDLQQMLISNLSIPVLVKSQSQSSENSNTASYNFTPLTVFSENDPDAAKEIIATFISETNKNIENLRQASNEKNIQTICSIAHKMLPTFIMIEAREATPALQWLENNRNGSISITDATDKVSVILTCAEDIICQAQKYLNK